MGNSYFQFKHFRIDQGDCAMKVTTDACILGAWAPVLPAVNRVLDIGAGTGLLSLMLAQRNPVITIHSVELDHKAAIQALANFKDAPWSSRLSLFEADIRDFKEEQKYDMVITNPPFFSNSLLGDKASKNLARHTVSLAFSDLLSAIGENLNEGGYAAILLPYPEYEVLQSLLKDTSWKEIGRLLIKHTDTSRINRVVVIISQRESDNFMENTLVIKSADNSYTPEFIQLLQPFYLDL